MRTCPNFPFLLQLNSNRYFILRCIAFFPTIKVVARCFSNVYQRFLRQKSLVTRDDHILKGH